jgi:hypothetical protein
VAVEKFKLHLRVASPYKNWENDYFSYFSKITIILMVTQLKKVPTLEFRFINLPHFSAVLIVAASRNQFVLIGTAAACRPVLSQHFALG